MTGQFVFSAYAAEGKGPAAASCMDEKGTWLTGERGFFGTSPECGGASLM